MKEFFDTIRDGLGSLSQSQVDGINALLKATEGLPTRHRAYILATSWHETARTMQPITEYGARSHFDKYEPSTSIGRALGNTLIGDGYKYRGRGYVQITGRANYQKASLATGRDLITDPDKALDPDVAAHIIVKGMTEGWFTGKKMADYVTYSEMRRVVNGTDKAGAISLYAVIFERALATIKASELPTIEFPPVGPPDGQASAIIKAILGIAAAVAALGAAVAAYFGLPV